MRWHLLAYIVDSYVSLCASRSRFLSMCWNPWVSILLGFLGFREYLCCVIWYYVWDLRLSPQRSGSGPFRFHAVGWYCFLLLPLRSIQDIVAGAFLLALPSFWLWIIDVWLYLFWWMLYFYWWMYVSCMLDDFTYLLYLYHGSEEDDLFLIFIGILF